MERSIQIRDTGIKITEVLNMISRGLSYYQILLCDPRLTLVDIMLTAKIASELIENFVTPDDRIEVSGSIEVVAKSGKIISRAPMQEEQTRSSKKWTPEEEQRLAELFHTGMSSSEMAKALERNRGAVKLRLRKLGLKREKEE